jgi:hypothetical protein
MGTWGSGIYDNDGALDGLASLVRLARDETDATRVVASIGLVAWLRPVLLETEPDELRAVVEGVDLGGLPTATREALAVVLADPAATARQGSRAAPISAAIGHASSGPRIDALLRFPGAASLIEELAERAAGRLDDALGGDEDLYEIAAEIAALGVLLELSGAGLWRVGRERLASWRTGLDTADRSTDEEREFWDRYLAHVRAGLDLLAH